MRYDLNIMRFTSGYRVVFAKILRELYRDSSCVML